MLFSCLAGKADKNVLSFRHPRAVTLEIRKERQEIEVARFTTALAKLMKTNPLNVTAQ